MALLVIAAVMYPSFARFAHTFEHHEHDICNEKYDTHFHEANEDCAFETIKLTLQYFYEFQNLETLSLSENHKIITSFYHSIPNNQKLQNTLRGPPIS